VNNHQEALATLERAAAEVALAKARQRIERELITAPTQELPGLLRALELLEEES
jgi:hypothetical protein